jgi:hypothetical protein
MGARNQVGMGSSYWPSKLHRPAESIPGLLKSFFLSKIDLRKGYFQLFMHPDDIPKAPFGIFEFLRFHFGLHLQDHAAIAGPDSCQPELHVQSALHDLLSQGALPSPAGSCPLMHLLSCFCLCSFCFWGEVSNR